MPDEDAVEAGNVSIEEAALLIPDDEPEDQPEIEESDDETGEEPEELDEDEEPDDESEESDADEEEEAAAPTFSVKDGTDDNGNPVYREVDEAELVAGWQRHRDYTVKTQELAEERRQFREQAQEQLAQWAIQDTQEPDWNAYLRQGYKAEQVMAAQHSWRQRQAKSEEAKQAYRQLQQEADEEQRAEMAKLAEASRERLLNDIPEWKDAKVREREVNEIVTVGRNAYRLTDEELGAMADDRMVRILRDAVRYRKLQGNSAAIEKRKSEPGKTLRPGTKTTAKQRRSNQQSEARKRFLKTGSIADAMKLDF